MRASPTYFGLMLMLTLSGCSSDSTTLTLEDQVSVEYRQFEPELYMNANVDSSTPQGTWMFIFYDGEKAFNADPFTSIEQNYIARELVVIKYYGSDSQLGELHWCNAEKDVATLNFAADNISKS